MGLPGSKGPLWYVLECLVTEAMEGALDVVLTVGAIGSVEREWKYE